MATSDEQMIPESVANKMIGSALTNYRLDILDKVMCEMKELLSSHMQEEPKDIKKIINKITDSDNERRLCEARINTKIEDNHKEAYTNFVQMRHLRIAVTLVITTVLLVGAFQAWSTKQVPANTSLELKIDALTHSINKTNKEGR